MDAIDWTMADSVRGMSEIPSDYRTQLDLRAEIARIDRDRAETHKLTAEVEKFAGEQRKLVSEAQKLDRDRWLAPLVVSASILGSAALAAVIAHVWR